MLAKDIAANPGQWISNLGAGVMDGIRNHLWTAFQTAVKEWFNQKVEELLGLGTTIWNLLKKGGMGMAEIGHMAWEGIKSAIPPALIQILIEKLVAMIVPAAGAVLAVIEGLQAAWGTVSRILQAMERFMAFMKAVKSGQSGPPFGAMLAAAGVILIDFAANWLLKRVQGAASKVAGKIKEIAKRIGDKLKKAMKKVGQKLRGGMKKLGDKAKKLKEKFFGKKSQDKNQNSKHKKGEKNKDEDKEGKKKEKLDKAVAAIKPQVERILKSGTSGLYLKAKLLFWKVRYGLTSLILDGSGKITAKVNPEADVAQAKKAALEGLLTVLFNKAQKDYSKQHEDEQLGRSLLPVLAAGEKDAERLILKDRGSRSRIAEARRKWRNREPNSLNGLSSIEQAMVLRTRVVSRPKGTRIKVASGVEILIPKQGGRGKIEFSKKAMANYGTAAQSLTEQIEKYGLSKEAVLSIVYGRQEAKEGKLRILRFLLKSDLKRRVQEEKRTKGKIYPGRIGGEVAEIHKFEKALRQLSTLSQAYEPSRRAGIHTANIVTSTMAMQDKTVGLDKLLSSEGEMAPMTPKGVAPEPTTKKKSNQKLANEKKAEKLMYQRIGYIFRQLLDTAKRQEILVSEGGYDLKDLATAVELWLEQRRSLSPQNLIARENLLRIEIVKLMSSHNGKV